MPLFEGAAPFPTMKVALHLSRALPALSSAPLASNTYVSQARTVGQGNPPRTEVVEVGWGGEAGQRAGCA